MIQNHIEIEFIKGKDPNISIFIHLNYTTSYIFP